MVWLNFQSLANQYIWMKPLVLHIRSLIVTQRSFTNNGSVGANLLLLISFQCAIISSFVSYPWVSTCLSDQGNVFFVKEKVVVRNIARHTPASSLAWRAYYWTKCECNILHAMLLYQCSFVFWTKEWTHARTQALKRTPMNELTKLYLNDRNSRFESAWQLW